MAAEGLTVARYKPMTASNGDPLNAHAFEHFLVIAACFAVVGMGSTLVCYALLPRAMRPGPPFNHRLSSVASGVTFIAIVFVLAHRGPPWVNVGVVGAIVALAWAWQAVRREADVRR